MLLSKLLKDGQAAFAEHGDLEVTVLDFNMSRPSLTVKETVVTTREMVDGHPPFNVTKPKQFLLLP